MEKMYVVHVRFSMAPPHVHGDEVQELDLDPCSEEEAKKLVNLINDLAQPLPKQPRGSARRRGIEIEDVNAELFETLTGGGWYYRGPFDVSASYNEHEHKKPNPVPEMIRKLESLK